MRLTEYLTEAAGQYGIVISRQDDGTFEDISLFDIDRNVPTNGEGHVQNLFNGFVEAIREHEAWGEHEAWSKVEAFLKEKAPQSKVLGADYADDEGFVNTLYGPFGMNQIGQLTDELDEMFGGGEDAEQDWDTDEFKRREFDNTEARAINRDIGRR